MRTILFYLFVSFALRVSAFGLAGTYERMWYWSAYQMEQQYSDEADRKIATGCRSCSFAQFITWIALPEDESTIRARFAAYKARNGRDYVPTSVDDGAGWLDDNGITKPIRLFRVVHDIGKTPALYQQVARQPPFSDAFLARKRVDTIRTAESHLTISTALRGMYDPDNKDVNNRPVYTGLVRDDNSKRLPNGKVVPDCDLKSAIDAIRREGKTVSIKKYYKYYRAGKLKATGSDLADEPVRDDRDNHAANVQEIQRAKIRMLGGVCHGL
ncbi:hypothetical protein N7535_000368 [Penicillium sp. DV-2018c]|nr:hypothetical protein N7461_006386 [Penicillium sp. DV-2018c]KAJ5581748.1 hypothetical protein N7535_000368 [Penicillium sp. DV-2018c]